MTSERPDLFENAIPLTTLDLTDDYAWISPDELLILRPEVVDFCHYPIERA